MKAAVLHRYDPELRNKEFLVYEEIDDPAGQHQHDELVCRHASAKMDDWLRRRLLRGLQPSEEAGGT